MKNAVPPSIPCGSRLTDLDLRIHIAAGAPYNDTNPVSSDSTRVVRSGADEYDNDAETRIFAAEVLHPLTLADTSRASSHVLYTPGGAVCRVVFLAGVLTELETREDFLFGRLADPTGALTLLMGKQEPVAREACTRMEPPVFVTCSGRIEVTGAGRGREVVIRPFCLYPVTREVRDLWITRTAEITLSRLGALERAVTTGIPASAAEGRVIRDIRPSLRDIAGIARTALSAMDQAEVKAAAPPVPVTDLHSEVLKAVAGLSGARGVAVEDLLHHFGGMGHSEDAVLETVRELIAGDELYQPQKGFIKIL